MRLKVVLRAGDCAGGVSRAVVMGEAVFETNDELAARLGAAMQRWSLSDAEPVAETATSWVLGTFSMPARERSSYSSPMGPTKSTARG